MKGQLTWLHVLGALIGAVISFFIFWSMTEQRDAGNALRLNEHNKMVSEWSRQLGRSNYNQVGNVRYYSLSDLSPRETSVIATHIFADAVIGLACFYLFLFRHIANMRKVPFCPLRYAMLFITIVTLIDWLFISGERGISDGLRVILGAETVFVFILFVLAMQDKSVSHGPAMVQNYEQREWTSTKDGHKFIAAYVREVEDCVIVRRGDDNKLVKMPRDKLHTLDTSYIQSLAMTDQEKERLRHKYSSMDNEEMRLMEHEKRKAKAKNG